MQEKKKYLQIKIIIYEELNFNHRKTKLYECHERNSNLSRKLLR